MTVNIISDMQKQMTFPRAKQSEFFFMRAVIRKQIINHFECKSPKISPRPSFFVYGRIFKILFFPESCVYAIFITFPKEILLYLTLFYFHFSGLTNMA